MIPVLIGFVSQCFVCSSKKVLFYILLPNQDQEKNVFFFERGNYHMKELIIMNAIDDNSCRYTCG